MHHTNFLLLDLGGVILNIDYHRTSEAFRVLTGHHFDEIYSQARQTELFDKFEKGQITSETFAEAVRDFFSGSWRDEEIFEAWNAMLLDLPETRLDFVEKIATKMPVFLLSNTNEVHKKAFDEILKKQGLHERFYALFSKAYFSHEIGMRKPDKEVFDFILNENNIPRTKLLFVDDSLQHIHGANSAGINTLFLEKGKVIESELTFLL